LGLTPFVQLVDKGMVVFLKSVFAITAPKDRHKPVWEPSDADVYVSDDNVYA
jgi:hypothetical protein